MREGAQVITSGWDIVEEFKAVFPEKLCVADAPENASQDIIQAERLIKFKRDDYKKRHITPKKEIDNRDSVEYIDLDKHLEGLTDDELTVISAITKKQMHIDDIIDSSGLNTSCVLSTLTMLEIKGCIKQMKGKLFSLNI